MLTTGKNVKKVWLSGNSLQIDFLVLADNVRYGIDKNWKL